MIFVSLRLKTIAMTTITLKINERTKAGKAFMTLIDFFKDSKTIEVIEPEMTTKEMAFIKDLEEGLLEVKAIQEGRAKGISIEDMVNEE